MKTRGKQSKLELSYLAGMIDADGHIGIVKSKIVPGKYNTPAYTLRVNVTNTDKGLRDWLIGRFGGTVTCRKHRAGLNWKPTYDWHYHNAKGAALLELIFPYLVIKDRQARLAIELYSGWVKDNTGTPQKEVERREELYKKFKQLNQVGIVQPERLNPEAPQVEDEAIV
jgi:hypothetical protein